MKSKNEVENMLWDTRWGKAVFEARTHGFYHGLANLIRSDDPVHPCARGVLAQILEGTLTPPDQRGKANSMLSPSDKEKIKDWLFEANSNAAVASACIERLADEMRMEPGELRTLINRRKAESISKIARHFDLAESTVRQFSSARDDADWGEAMAGLRQVRVGDSEPFDLFPDNGEMFEGRLRSARAWLENPDLFPDLTE